MAKFSKANAKIESLGQVESLKPYLAGKRKVYSFDMLSGWSCPFAEQCLSKVSFENGHYSIQDGPKTQFRCFSASQEVAFPNVYRLRKSNFEAMRQYSRRWEFAEHLNNHMPKDLGICRIHVAGDFYNEEYFLGWLQVAAMNPSRLFYAYTKSLSYWVNNKYSIPANFILTASYGGKWDKMIHEHGLRSSTVVFSVEQAEQLGLEIDHDDSHAADPTKASFALLIHGVQPAGSEASKAIKQLRKNKVKFSYAKG